MFITHFRVRDLLAILLTSDLVAASLVVACGGAAVVAPMVDASPPPTCEQAGCFTGETCCPVYADASACVVLRPGCLCNKVVDGVPCQ